MIVPLGDTPNPRGFTAWVNLALIAVNVAVYLLLTLPLSLQGADPGDPATQAWLEHLQRQAPQLGLGALFQRVTAWDVFVFVHAFKTAAPSLSSLFSAMFMHAGFAHLAGNMLFLWIYGDNVEHRLGRIPYLLFWLCCGAAATAFYSLWSGPSMTPMLGASGAISGVLGAYFILFPGNRVRLLVALFPWYMDVVLVNARFVLGAYLLLDNLLPALLGARSGVAYGAHIGGFLAGLLIALLLGRGERRRAQQRENPARMHLELGRALLQRGQVARARAHLLRALEADPDPDTRHEARALLAGIELRRW